MRFQREIRCICEVTLKAPQENAESFLILLNNRVIFFPDVEKLKLEFLGIKK